MLQIPPSEVTGLGSAGLLIYLVIKEVLVFSGKRTNGKKSGELDPSYWELKFGQIVREQTEPLMENQREMTEILTKILEKQNDTNFVIAKLLMRGVRPSPPMDE